MAGSSAVYTPCRPHAPGRHRLLPLPADNQQPRGLLSWRTRARAARARASLVATAPTRTATEEAVYEVVLRQAVLVEELQGKRTKEAGRRRWREEEEDAELGWGLLGDAYDRCGEVCAEYAKTFYLGTQLMTPERRKAVWAIYVWCRRTDELVDGPNSSYITPKALDRWEKRLEDLFEGRPYDMYDAALSDTASKFPIDIQPFKDMIEGNLFVPLSPLYCSKRRNRRRLLCQPRPPAKPRVPLLSGGRSGGGRVGEPRIFDPGVYMG